MKHFEPGQPVVYRTELSLVWNYSLYNRITTNGTEHLVVGGYCTRDKDILPYNNNTKHLIGTVNSYVEWEPEPYTVIAVRDDNKVNWKYRLFVCMDDENRYVCKTDGNTVEYAWQYATSIEESLKD